MPCIYTQGEFLALLFSRDPTNVEDIDQSIMDLRHCAWLQALAAALVSDRPDGLVPTVVVDEDMVSLGLCYSNKESLEEAIKRRLGVYWRSACIQNVHTVAA